MIRQRGYYDSTQNIVTQVIAYVAVEMGKTMYKDETIRGRHKPANGIGLSLNLNKLFCSKARVLVSNHSHQGNLFNE